MFPKHLGYDQSGISLLELSVLWVGRIQGKCKINIIHKSLESEHLTKKLGIVIEEIFLLNKSIQYLSTQLFRIKFTNYSQITLVSFEISFRNDINEQLINFTASDLLVILTMIAKGP